MSSLNGDIHTVSILTLCIAVQIILGIWKQVLNGDDSVLVDKELLRAQKRLLGWNLVAIIVVIILDRLAVDMTALADSNIEVDACRVDCNRSLSVLEVSNDIIDFRSHNTISVFLGVLAQTMYQLFIQQ